MRIALAARLNIALGVIVRLYARIASAIPGATRSATASVLAYHELYKIDRYINEGKYESSIDFFAGSSIQKRVWLKKKDEVLQMSYGGYTLQKFLYNNSEIIYPNSNEEIYEKISNKLQSHFVEKRKFTARMEKKIKSDEINLEVIFVAVINIEYEFENDDIDKPNTEYVKEFVISENVQ